MRQNRIKCVKLEGDDNGEKGEKEAISKKNIHAQNVRF